MYLNITTATMIPSSVVDQYRAVGASGSLTSATGDWVYGIVKTPAKEDGASMEVVTGGECYAIAGEDVTIGSRLTGGSNGELVIGIVGTNEIVAHALETAAAGDVFRVKLV